ncbi:MAG: hypothetical protein ACI32E_07025 [Bacilli bacterium]
MNNKTKKNEPLMFIQTIQKIENKNKSQKAFDSRSKKRKAD